MYFFQSEYLALKRQHDFETFSEIQADVDYWFGRVHDLPALHMEADGFQQGEATKSDLADLAERDIITVNKDGEFDFSPLDELYLQELEKALNDAQYHFKMVKLAEQ